LGGARLMSEILIKANNIKKYFDASKGFLNKNKAQVHAVDGVSIEIYDGETLALVGESGCGKSTFGRVLIRLIEATEGEVYFKGKNILKINNEELRNLRKEMQIVFQDPYASLNPRMKILDIIGEPLTTHGIVSRVEKEKRVKELMNLVGLRQAYIERYPHQFSGGQRQRIGIARALALSPKFVVCDEPVSALDVSIQAQIINLLEELQDKKGLTYLFISHDLNVVRYIADRVCVMFLGKIVEVGPTREVYKNPMHPYTKFLIAASPQPDPHLRNKEKLILEGDVPSPIDIPSGCRFHTRCPYAKKICSEKEPPTSEISGHKVSCHFPLI
jgi:oligopeptide/dipeptide ABC transporter ATP-binding protein